MNDKLILNAAVVGDSLVVLTKNMPDRLRGKGELTTRGGIALVSHDGPQTGSTILCLAGSSRSRDDQVAVLHRFSHSAAQEALKAIARMVREINAKAPSDTTPPDITWQRLE